MTEQKQFHKCKYCGISVDTEDDESCYQNPKNNISEQEQKDMDEFYNLFVDRVGNRDEDAEIVRQWIETKKAEWETHARMEQDIINFNGFLEKQDQIIRDAKIEENEHHKKKIGLLSKYGEFIDKERAEAMTEVFNNRIDQLKEKSK